MEATEPAALSNFGYAVSALAAELNALAEDLGPRLDELEQTRSGPPDEHKTLLHLTNGSPRWELKREGQTRELLHLTRTQLEECAAFMLRVQHLLGVGDSRPPADSPALLQKLRSEILRLDDALDDAAAAQPLRWLRDRREKTFADALYDVALLTAALIEFLVTAELDIQLGEEGRHRRAAAELFRSLCDVIDLG
jgi:hypothetical protein